MDFEFDSIAEWMEFGENNLGPILMAKAALEPQGKWEALRNDLVALYEGANESTDGSMLVRAEYLRTTVSPQA